MPRAACTARAALVGLACLQLASTSAMAQSERAALQAGRTQITAGFFDPAYAQSENRQHLGIDFAAGAESDVFAPVDGDIVVNRTYASDVMQAYLVIRTTQGNEHVLGHISSSLAVGTHVIVGERVGAVRAWPNQPRRSHVHWGVNRTGVTRAIGDDWGWGRAPASATRLDAANRGWLDPSENPSPAPQTALLSGSWRGLVTQGRQTYDMTVTFLSATQAEVRYHQLNCSGAWRLTERNGSLGWVFEETISPGAHICIVRGQVRLTQRSDGGLDYAWQGGSSRAILRRQDGSAATAPPPHEDLQEGVYIEPNFFGRRSMGNKILWEVNCHGSPRLGCETLRGGPFVLFAPQSPHRARFTALAERIGNCTLFCPGKYQVDEDAYSITMVSSTQMIIRTVASTRDHYGQDLQTLGSVVLDVRATGSDTRMPWQIWNVLEAPGVG